jgi:hypothetical protein
LKRGNYSLKKILKWVFIFIGIIVLGVAVLVFSFWQSMKPEKSEVAKITEQAEQHLKGKYPHVDMEIFDTLYDNMGNFNYFEYAANVENKEDGTQFLVFYNEETAQTEDSYIADKWEDELEDVIRPYLEEKFKELDELWIFIDERIEYELSVNVSEPNTYRDYDANPSIMIFLPRELNSEDEQLFKEFITFLKEEASLKHASVSLEYIREGVPLEEKIWSETF